MAEILCNAAPFLMMFANLEADQKHAIRDRAFATLIHPASTTAVISQPGQE